MSTSVGSGTTKPSSSKWPLFAASALGTIGLLTGYIAPLRLNPWSNIGPITGLFFTGPAGAVAGVVLGLVARYRYWAPSRFLVSLAISGVVLFALSLTVSLPDDGWVADVVEVRILRCTPPIAYEPHVLSDWESSIAINPQNPVAASWRADAHAALASSTDLVADVEIVRRVAVNTGRKPWNRGHRYLRSSLSAAQTDRFVVATALCKASSRSPSTLMTRRPTYDGFPPDSAAALLNLEYLDPLPPEIADLVATAQWP